MKLSISKVYALVFYEHGNEEEQDALYQNVLELKALFKRSEPLGHFFYDSPLTNLEKYEVFIKVVKPQAFLKRILAFLHYKKRFSYFPEVLEAYQTHYEEQRGIKRIVVITSVSLDDQKKKLIRASLERFFNTKKPTHFEYRERPTIKGGLKVMSEGILYDRSIEGVLRRLKRVFGTN